MNNLELYKYYIDILLEIDKNPKNLYYVQYRNFGTQSIKYTDC